MEAVLAESTALKAAATEMASEVVGLTDATTTAQLAAAGAWVTKGSLGNGKLVGDDGTDVGRTTFVADCFCPS